MEGLNNIITEILASQNWKNSNDSNCEIGQNHDFDHFKSRSNIHKNHFGCSKLDKIGILKSLPFQKGLTIVVSLYTV